MIATLRLILDQVRVQGVEVQNIHFRLLAESRAEPQHYGSLRSPSCCGSAKSVNHVVSTSVSDVVRTFTAPPYHLCQIPRLVTIRLPLPSTITRGFHFVAFAWSKAAKFMIVSKSPFLPRCATAPFMMIWPEPRLPRMT